MKREERTIYNQLRKNVASDTINVEIPMTYTHEARQAMHELLTIEKKMYALCIFWNNILNAYCVHYERAMGSTAIAKRREQEVSDIDDVTADLTSHDYTWTGYKKPAQQNEQTTEQNEKEDNAMLIIKTKKFKANGLKYKGFFHTVTVTDGKNTVSFVSDGEDHVDFNCLGDAMDENGVRYIRDDGHKLHLMRAYYKGGDIEKQKARMLAFVDKVLAAGINVKFTEEEGELLYTA